MQVRCDALLASPCPARVARGFFNVASREHHQGREPPDIHGQIDNAGRWPVVVKMWATFTTTLNLRYY